MAVRDSITSLIDTLHDPTLELDPEDRELLQEALGLLYEYDDPS